MTDSGVNVEASQELAQLLQEQGSEILNPYASGYHGYSLAGSGFLIG